MSTIIGVVACVLALYVIWVITKKIVMALFFALVVGAIVYVGIPMLADRDDQVGNAAKKVNEVRQNVQDRAVDSVRSGEAGRAIKSVKDKAQALVDDPVVREGAKLVGEAAQGGKSDGEAQEGDTDKK